MMFDKFETVAEFSYFMVYIFEGCARLYDPKGTNFSAIQKLSSIVKGDALRIFRNALVHNPQDSTLIYTTASDAHLYANIKACVVRLGVEVDMDEVKSALQRYTAYHRARRVR